ncbi:MAG: CoA transferase [Alphaproteobacteria bacterium]
MTDTRSTDMTQPETPIKPPVGPLSGITVLDLTRVLAGPYCTMILNDLGARIIKVEPPGGDDSRGYGPWLDGHSAYFMSLNRGKESIVLDLKNDKDRKVFDKLLSGTDVLVENFRPGTMAKLGYGWETIHARHPELIYAACSGFGQTGPDSGRPAYDMVVQGMGGLMSLTGHEGGPPTRVGTAIGDITAGLFTTIGVNAALFDRTKTGAGQFIDISMLDCQIAILENAIARYFATGISPGPSAARHPSIAPFECYESQNSHIIIAAGNDALFAKLCKELGTPELTIDSRFNTNRARIENVAALKKALERILKTHDTNYWLQKLETAGVPCGPLNTVADVVKNPQVQSRNMVVEIDDDQTTRLKIAGNPIKLNRYSDPDTRAPAPALNQHRDFIEKQS